MKFQSIRSHLTPYEIFKKRKTTISHAFASALAPCDEYDEEVIHTALINLGQNDLNNLLCVYCEKPAQTWDHLVNLVKNGEFNGYGHQVGNLVPCCRDCNSKKQGKDFREFVNSLPLINYEKQRLILKLEKHLCRASYFPESSFKEISPELYEEFKNIRDKIILLMKEADSHAHSLRKIRKIQ